MATHETLTSLFSAIADKIRKKTGSTDVIIADDFPDAIDSILTPTDGTITKKAAATYTPTTSNQTIAAGTYLSGTQTIKGDSNLVAENIKSGVNIFGVDGEYSGASITPIVEEHTVTMTSNLFINVYLNNNVSSVLSYFIGGQATESSNELNFYGAIISSSYGDGSYYYMFGDNDAGIRMKLYEAAPLIASVSGNRVQFNQSTANGTPFDEIMARNTDCKVIITYIPA